MAEETKIEWTDSTFNPFIGCTKVSPGCDHCYAEALMDKRHHRVKWGGKPVLTSDANWKNPLKWQRQAAAFYEEHGRKRRVFCSSLADVFDNNAPDEWRRRLAVTIMETPDLEWLLLTKRIGNAYGMLYDMFGLGLNQEKYLLPDNVRVGATIVNQKEAERDLRKLVNVAQISTLLPFLSMEPLLEKVCLTGVDPGWSRYIGWVIAGGESGHDARRMHPQWVIHLRDECEANDVPFLFKQWGTWMPRDVDNIHFSGTTFDKVGKGKAGRRLHGETLDGFPVA